MTPAATATSGRPSGELRDLIHCIARLLGVLGLARDLLPLHVTSLLKRHNPPLRMELELAR